MLDRADRLNGSDSGGSDLRTAFQRDRDRILYSGHFRRLAGITQVTTPTELFSFHNRLTHSLEVAQVARRIAERANILDPAIGISPDVCESAALAHDLGHPPFGHSGELILDEVARSSENPDDPFEDGFEGNAQSLRILLKLSRRSAIHKGLDLTVATLRASIKYPWLRNGNPAKPGKFGVYLTEEEEFNVLWSGLELYGRTPECEIMDWSDDVAYSTHDFFDFALAGLIPITALKHSSPEDLRQLLTENATTNSVREASQASGDAFVLVCNSFALLPEPPLLKMAPLGSSDVGMLRQWVSYMISQFAGDAIRFAPDAGNFRLDIESLHQEQVAILKALTYIYAIGSPALAIRREGEKQILTTLFNILSRNAHHDLGLFDEDARANLEYGVPKTRVILDVLSAMTDAQATSMYLKLTGVSPVSILETSLPTLS